MHPALPCCWSLNTFTWWRWSLIFSLYAKLWYYMLISEGNTMRSYACMHACIAPRRHWLLLCSTTGLEFHVGLCEWACALFSLHGSGWIVHSMAAVHPCNKFIWKTSYNIKLSASWKPSFFTFIVSSLVLFSCKRSTSVRVKGCDFSFYIDFYF